MVKRLFGRCFGGPAVAAGILVAISPATLTAHPHIFVDGGADFLFDGEGRLAGIRVIWIYDAFASLFTLEALEISPDEAGRLTPEGVAKVVADQTTWEDGFEGDSYLWIGGEEIELGGPLAADASLDGQRLSVVFERRLAEPVPVDGLQALVKLYDPTYYFAYFTTHAPVLENAPAGCAADVEEFQPDSMLAELQTTLMALSREETPEQENVGALFADRIYLRCD